MEIRQARGWRQQNRLLKEVRQRASGDGYATRKACFARERARVIALAHGSGHDARPVSELAPILVAFARPEESRAFCRRVADFRRDNGVLFATGQIGLTEVGVMHIGIGPQAAERSLRAVFQERAWRLVVVAGFAGALAPKLSLGDIVMEELPSQAPCRIISTDLPVETAAAKRALHAQTGAQAVDMETQAVARVCAERSVPLLAVRVISDAAETDLPVPFSEWFHLEKQRARPIRLLAYLARHPGRIPPFARFVRAIPKISEALALAVEGSIVGMEHI